MPDSAALAHTTDFLHAWYGPPAGSGTNRSATGALLLGDCLEVMARMPSGSFKAVVTSPPYNLRTSSGNGMRDGRGGKWESAAL